MQLIHDTKELLGRALKNMRAEPDKLAQQPRISEGEEFAVWSDAFFDGDLIPTKYAGDGLNLSPGLFWSSMPVGTKELMLVMEDPDAPMPEPYVHWILQGISPETTSVPAALPAHLEVNELPGASQCRNSSGTLGYTGPLPPAGHGRHHYHFQIFALNERVRVPEAPEREELRRALQGHVLGQGELVGTYERL
jgi:Raf kinase inhibitor-like YbhB/YbcL family protein